MSGTPTRSQVFLGLIAWFGLALGAWILYVSALEPLIFPAKAQARAEGIAAREAQRTADEVAKEARYQALMADRAHAEEKGRLDKAQKEREIAEQIAESREKEDAANIAAFERYAECQIRNQTPGYCAEDWQPTTEIREMMEDPEGLKW